MTDEEKRITIAEACGWKWDCLGIQSPSGDTHSRYAGDECDGRDTLMEVLPRYTEDLNAMHEAEKIFDVDIQSFESSRYVYSKFLYSIVPAEMQPFRSTARQRADAFLMAIGRCPNLDF